MAKLVALCALLVGTVAHADSRLGVTFATRATGSSFDAAGSSSDLSYRIGARYTLSFGSAPIDIPAPETIASDFKLAPELFGGLYANDVHAEGYVGAGLRGELWLASHKRGAVTRLATYVAARGLVIGGHQDGAIELALGQYILTSGGRRSVGFEGGVMMRPRHDTTPDQSHELDALISIFVGWR